MKGNSEMETIEDIVADIRQQNQGLPEDSYALSPLVCDLLSFADRIEAAHKREREAGAEAAQICGEIGEMIERGSTREKSSQVGNAAAMREACANIAEYAKTAACHTEDAHLLGYLNQIERWAEAALSAPPRNCDVLSVKQEALAAIHEDRCYVNNPIDERRLTVEWLFAEAKGE